MTDQERCSTACTPTECPGIFVGSVCQQPPGSLIDPLTLLQIVRTNPAPVLEPVGMVIAASRRPRRCVVDSAPAQRIVSAQGEYGRTTLMKIALIAMVTVAIGLGVTIRTASAGKEIEPACCACFDCGDNKAATSGGAAGTGPVGPVACFTGFGPGDSAACSDFCGTLGCESQIIDSACSLEDCDSINGQAATSQAPLFQPIGMILAVFAAALAGGWSLLRRRRVS